MNTNQRYLVIFILAMSLATLSCRFGQALPPTPTSTLTLTPLPTSTLPPSPLPISTLTFTPLPTNTPDPKILTLKATNDVLKLLEMWNGKYVVIVSKNTDIKTLSDLNGAFALCDSAFKTATASKDMAEFNAAAGTTMLITYGTNIPQFLQIMSGNQNIVAFVTKSNADTNSLQSNPNLKIIVFE